MDSVDSGNYTKCDMSGQFEEKIIITISQVLLRKEHSSNLLEKNHSIGIAHEGITRLVVGYKL